MVSGLRHLRVHNLFPESYAMTTPAPAGLPPLPEELQTAIALHRVFSPKRVAELMQAYALAAISDVQEAEGQIVVTKTEGGAIVSVTRQDEEGRILEIIAQDTQPAQQEGQKHLAACDGGGVTQPLADAPRWQVGTWTLTAPDGRTWQADSPLKACGAEQRDRIPPEVALKRIFDALNDGGGAT